MELLMGLGWGAKELFQYNRENFKFDKEQTIEREALRLEMQVKRFELFREDVRDLVELTVDRMDMYHLVGALFLEFCIVLFCEGRVQASAPPFLLSLFLLSNACAFIYLILAVWLSMHASIASHSFGVRLLTRFVRLPIPSVKQITQLRSQLGDYERQGVANLLRLPFQDRQDWKQVDEAEKEDASGGTPQSAGPPPSAAEPSGLTLRPREAKPSLPRVSVSPPPGRRNPSSNEDSSAQASEDARRRASLQSEDMQLLPDEVELPLGGEDLLAGHQGARPERHVQLFRQLQSKWQCYDAYCRVCMGLGVNQILQGLSYYCICHTLVENRSPSTGYALVFLFQSCTIGLAVLDLAGLKRREIFVIQAVGVMPCFLTAWGVAHGHRDEGGILDPEQAYILSPLSFICQVLWLELWLRVAAPSGEDGAKLPRRFRQVLFLDVFGDDAGWNENQDEEGVVDGMLDDINNLDGALDPDDEETREDDDAALDSAMEMVSTQLTLAQCAIRRWKAVPDRILSASQRQDLDRLREQLNTWGGSIRMEMERRSTKRGLQAPEGIFRESDLQRWHDLSPEERLSDPFADCLLGPFQQDSGSSGSVSHYFVERQQILFEDEVSQVCPGALVLTLEAVAAVMKDLEKEARELLELRITTDLRAETRRRESAARIERNKNLRARLLAKSEESPRPPRSLASEVNFGDGGVPPELRKGQSVRHRRGDGVGRRRNRRLSQEHFPNLVSMFKEKGKKQLASRIGSSSKRRAEDRLGLLAPEPSPSIAPSSPPASVFGQAADSSPPLSAGATQRASPSHTLSPRGGSVAPAPLREAASGSTARGSPRELGPVLAEAGLAGSFTDGGLATPPGGGGRPSPPLSPRREDGRDPTLVAMAGQHAKHFVPERLPWQVLSRMSRVLQMCWLWSGFMAFLKEAHIYQMDFQQHPGKGGRRLCPAAPPWAFSQEPVAAWPHGASFFRPQGLVCALGSATNASDASGLIVSSPYALYSVRRGSRESAEPGSLSWRLEEVERFRVQPGAALICSPEAQLCLSVAPSAADGGLKVRAFGHSAASGSAEASDYDDDDGEEVLLALEDASWQLVAGAIVPCAGGAARFLSSRQRARAGAWCLLLAGWDGELLPVAVVPLPSGGEIRPPTASAAEPAFDVPLWSSSDAEELLVGVEALHVEPRSGRLWAALKGGDVAAWDLFNSKSLGRWRPAWPGGAGVAATFAPAALCEDPERGLFVLGRSEAQGAMLLRAESPLQTVASD